MMHISAEGEVECEECSDLFDSTGEMDIETYSPGCTRREFVPDESVCPKCQEIPTHTITIEVKYKDKGELRRHLELDNILLEFIAGAIECPSAHVESISVK